MKKILSFLFTIIFAQGMAAQSLLVGTYNIRNNRNSDTKHGNGWEVRHTKLCAQIDFLMPDIFGVQEAYKDQMDDMKAALDGYDYIGVGREDGREEGEYSGIFFKTDRLTLLDKGNFWLNETPDRPVLGWDAACVRICSWGRFRHEPTGRELFFFNLHMDHVGVVARREGAKLVMRKIEEITKGTPAILTGDFNVDQNDEIHDIFTQGGLLSDAYDAASRRFAENGTFVDYKSAVYTPSRIDHVMVTKDWTVSRYAVLTDCYWDAEGNRRTLSDHYPVFARISCE